MMKRKGKQPNCWRKLRQKADVAEEAVEQVADKDVAARLVAAADPVVRGGK
jgi:hypothetical protein